MGMGRSKLLLASIALAGAAAIPFMPARSAEGAANFPARILAEHNRERDRMRLPRLEWSARLAQDARDWAERLAHRGSLEHATQFQRNSAGENLWMGSAGYFTAEDMVSSFLSEKQYFRPGEFPNVSTTGRWQDVGHYTQVIWRETEEVGCALVNGGQHEFLVCRYWPGGNWLGRQVG